jgi:hypothetical protein
MRVSPSVWIAAAGVALGMPVWSQNPAPAPRPGAAAASSPAALTPTPPPSVEGLVGELIVETSLPSMKDAPASPEAQALLGKLKDKATLKTQIFLAHDLSRQEVVSTDFMLPPGTVILHEAGSKFYVIADPKAQTYVVMDAEGIMKAIEGGIGIENSQYSAKATHTGEKKEIGGVACRKTILAVTYVSSIPFENDRVMVQQTNDIEVWHTPTLVSRALLDHFFFKFQRDKTSTVQKVAAIELGFPMELSMSITQGSGPRSRPAGALRMSIASIRKEKRLNAEIFRIPPAGYKKLDRNPYFTVVP